MVLVGSDMIRLSELRLNETATVERILARGFLRQRLLELGLVEGTWVRCDRLCPSGQSAVYLVRAARLAIRHCDGAQILVRRT